MRARLIATLVALASLALPATALAKSGDRDRDRMPDRWEKKNGLNHKKNDARKDRDRDGLRNIDEFRSNSDPRDADTDDDGVRDGQEGAGTIASFNTTTGVLVINLFGGGTLTGKVDSTTEIDCEGADDDAPAAGTTGDTRGDGTPEDRRVKSGSDDGDRSGSNSGGDDVDDDNDDGDRSGPSSSQGDDHGDDEGDCSAADLTAGRTVDEAELNQGDDGPADVFHEIELG